MMMFSLSCKRSISVSASIKAVLDRAGDNKSELEKVVRHYSADSRDSLKLRAVFFLIRNIDGLKTLDTTNTSTEIYFNALDQIWQNSKKKHNVSTVSIAIDSINDVKETNPENFNANYLDELKTISSEFLIENIEDSFYVWQNMPWAKNVKFDDFCEYILAYRCTNTYSNDSRKIFLSKYEGVSGTLKSNNSFEVSKPIIKDIDSWFTEDPAIFARYSYLRPISFQNLLKGKIGECVDANSLKVMALRSLGVPAALDNIPNWGNSNSSHYWYKIIDSANDTIKSLITNDAIRRNTQYIISGSSYDLYPTHNGIPKEVLLQYGRTVPKVYRLCFSKQAKSLENIRSSKDEIPTYFKNDRLKDVTSEYVKCADVNIEVDKSFQRKNKFLYLCVFDNRKWKPISWTKIENSVAIFKDMGKNVMYLPAFFEGNQIIPAGAPFLLTNQGTKKQMAPKKETESVRLFNKYPYRSFVDAWQRIMIGGRFQLANKSDLSDTITIKKIEELPFYQTEIKVNSPKEFRYLVYQFNNLPQVLVSEIDVWGLDNTNKEIKLSGKLIGNPGKYPHTADQITDGNRHSYFAKKENSDSYIGFDLGEKNVRITKIRYIPRNDDNSVVPDVDFELFYWKEGWVTLGIKKGSQDKTILFRNVPKNALLLLKNMEGGSENRIFTYRDGQQFFW